jgi:hypothetical protein
MSNRTWVALIGYSGHSMFAAKSGALHRGAVEGRPEIELTLAVRERLLSTLLGGYDNYQRRGEP